MYLLVKEKKQSFGIFGENYNYNKYMFANLRKQKLL